MFLNVLLLIGLSLVCNFYMQLCRYVVNLSHMHACLLLGFFNKVSATFICS